MGYIIYNSTYQVLIFQMQSGCAYHTLYEILLMSQVNSDTNLHWEVKGSQIVNEQKDKQKESSRWLLPLWS